jgi:hypothetical protein
MLRKRVMRGLTVVGLGAMLTVGVGAWGVASAAPQSPVQSYTGRSERSTSTNVASSRGPVRVPWC